ncbi:hypothetical protein C1646_749908 [Rhizophagus diaphanus]|nr:hypothetical protein C1646_749908 [Rhizophagus diaphanus] [Rhizophagus sp. MUCL 43196]
MERNSRNSLNSDLSVGDEYDGVYELMKILGDDESDVNSRKPYTGWDYIDDFGQDAWDQLYQARLARHRNILLRLFTGRLPNLSDQARNGLFDVFSSSDAFGVEEHNSLLDTLAHPVEGLSLSKYDVRKKY